MQSWYKAWQGNADGVATRLAYQEMEPDKSDRGKSNTDVKERTAADKWGSRRRGVKAERA